MIFPLIGILTFTYFLSINVDFKIFKTFCLIIAIIIFILYEVRFLVKYLKWFLLYMFNEKLNEYDKRIEKPRLLIYLIFTPIFYYTLTQYKNILLNDKLYFNIIKLCIFNCVVFVSSLFLDFTWRKVFINSLIINIKNNLKKVEYGKLDRPHNEKIEKIYSFIKGNDFISETITKESFIKDFLINPIELNFSVPALRDFYNAFYNYFENLQILRPNEFILLFINSKTGKEYDLKQFSKSQEPNSREYEMINKFFKEEIIK